MQFQDYYKILGVAATASDEEIKRAYRKLARKYHPDVSKEPDAEDRFKELSEAYEVLRNEEQRAAYDQLRSQGFRAGEEFRPPPDWQEQYAGPGHFTHHQFSSDDLAGFSDFFQSVFGDRFSTSQARYGQQYQRAYSAEDVHARIEISLEEAYSGGKKRLHYQQPTITTDGRTVTTTKTIDVNIPAGVAHGQHLRLKNLGAKLPRGEQGDLYIEVEIAPHSLFTLNGLDLGLTLPVTPWEAALGAKVTVPTPGGKVSLSIPAGSRQGKRLRLKGRGMPGSPAGDLTCTLQLCNPPELSKPCEDLYRQLAERCSFNPRKSLGGA